MGIMQPQRAYLVEARGPDRPAVMLDLARAVEHAAWRHGTVRTMVTEDELLAARARIERLEAELAEALASLAECQARGES
jgi:hypothetical protein